MRDFIQVVRCWFSGGHNFTRWFGNALGLEERLCIKCPKNEWRAEPNSRIWED